MPQAACVPSTVVQDGALSGLPPANWPWQYVEEHVALVRSQTGAAPFLVESVPQVSVTAMSA